MDRDTFILRDVDMTLADQWIDPYPQLDALRRQGPLVWCPEWDMWLTASYGTANDLLRHPSTERVFEPRQPESDWESFNRLNALAALDRSGSDHTRLRRAMGSPFRRANWAQIEQIVHQVVDDLLSSLAAEDSVNLDLVPTFIEPLPVRVISLILGFSTNEGNELRDASERMVSAFEKTAMTGQQQRGQKGAQDMETLISSAVVDSTNDHRGHALQFLQEHCPANLSFEELVAAGALLFNGGTGAVINALSTGVVTVLREPGVKDALHGCSSATLSSAVDEILRYDAPLQLFERVAMYPVETPTVTIPEGDRIGLLLGGANHDPEVFAQPKRFNVFRNPNPHLTFSAGSHFCLGASLARLEIHTALEKLLNRFSGIKLSGEPVRHNGFVVRGYDSIPVQLIS